MNYPYNYMQDLQNMRDRIDNQMRQLAQHSDFKSVLGEDTQLYIQASSDWYFDEDIQNTEEAKLYNYYKYIVK